MDENLRETTELPESGGTVPNEENEPETKSIRFVPSAYDPRGIEQWLSERAAEGKLLLRYDDFVIGEPRDCRYHLEPAADDDDPDELLREKRARLGWEYVCRTKDGIFYIWRGEKPRMSQRRRTVRTPMATADCAKAAPQLFSAAGLSADGRGAHFSCVLRVEYPAAVAAHDAEE